MEREDGHLLILTAKSSPQQSILIASENDKLSNLPRKRTPLCGLKSCAVSHLVPLSRHCSNHVPTLLLQQSCAVVCAALCPAVPRNAPAHLFIPTSTFPHAELHLGMKVPHQNQPFANMPKLPSSQDLFPASSEPPCEGEFRLISGNPRVVCSCIQHSCQSS